MAYFVPKYSRGGFLPAKIWLNKFRLIYVKQDANAQSMIRWLLNSHNVDRSDPSDMNLLSCWSFCSWDLNFFIFWIETFNISSLCLLVAYFVPVMAFLLPSKCSGVLVGRSCENSALSTDYSVNGLVAGILPRDLWIGQ